MTKLHSDQRINWLNQTSGFNTVNGLRIVEWTDGNASLSVDLVPGHLNPPGSCMADSIQQCLMLL